MNCEVCGNQIFGEPSEVLIEGAKMITCKKCSSLGSTIIKSSDQPLYSSTLKTKRKNKSIYTPRPKATKSVKISEDLVITEKWSDLIRNARRKLGLRHEDLGRKMGIKVSLLKKIESGKVTPEHRLAINLEHSLGIKLLVPFIEPKGSYSTSTSQKGFTLGEIAHLKKSRRKSNNEGNHSKS